MDIQELIKHPQESLSVELKAWIDPETSEGIAKIVKAAIALRNYGGGYLLIGFDDETGTPIFEGIPDNLEKLFHIDNIQGFVTKYSSEPFEITIHFPTLKGKKFPVVEIPSGVKTPVAMKKDLNDNGGQPLLREHEVYIRSLNSNNKPSTTKATWKDWNNIIEVCFENREADIGRFLRRHLGGLSPEIIKQLAVSFMEAAQPDKTTEESAHEYLQESEKRYEAVIEERGVTLPKHGAWEVAVIIDGDVPSHSANLAFLNLLNSNNSRYTGWPIWIILQNTSDDNKRPYVEQSSWEAFIITDRSIDFWRLNPTGKFFLRSALADDVVGGSRSPKPLKAFDFGLATYRTGEAIAVALSFAKAMGCALGVCRA